LSVPERLAAVIRELRPFPLAALIMSLGYNPSAMQITLIPIDRSNYRALWRLQVKPEQRTFVSPPAWSLVRCYVKALGEEYEHLPHLISADGTTVGFSTIVCDPHSEEEYWIDDIMIDATQQRRGYGRAAVVETLRTILKRYPRCRAVQLVCFRGNNNAEALYLSLGFVKTGETDPVFDEPIYRLSGSELDELR
jgi:diamine N-acetyltransferase